MTYGSIATGIGTETLAWEPLGWKALWFSEIDPFPSAVLKHHWPDIPNLGDMCKLSKKKIFNETNPDIIVGGTPCQSFSISGLRGGMDDQRGNLSLEFCRILLKKQPQWFVWENVPGVFSSFSDEKSSKKVKTKRGGNKKNKRTKRTGRERMDDADTIVQSSDFAALLTGFRECGYSVCYRVLDSKNWGVPQRRRRVYVVGYLGERWQAPFAVLFEQESLYGHPAKSKEERQGITGTTKSNTSRNSRSTGIADPLSHKPYADRGSDNNLIVDEKKWPHDQSATLDASYGRLQGVSGQDEKHGFSTLVAFGGNNTSGEIKVATAVKGHNNHQDFESETFIVQKPVIIEKDMLESGDNSSHAMNCSDSDQTPAVVRKPHGVVYSIDQEKNAYEDISGPLRSHQSGGNEHAVIYPAAQITSPDNRSNPKPGDPSPTLTKRAEPHIVITEETKVFQNKASSRSSMNPGDISPTLDKSKTPSIYNNKRSIIRRLTPVECERLQSYPDNHTNIPWGKKKTSPDTLRYQAVGNGMTKNVMEWIGKRIDKVQKILYDKNGKAI